MTKTYECDITYPLDAPTLGYTNVMITCSDCQRFLGIGEMLINKAPADRIHYQPCGSDRC